MSDRRLDLARSLMEAFATDTGLLGQVRPRRYLWTDAFAVCNYLELESRTGESRYLELALRLVDQVHHVLGRHRDDDPRRGWVSGLSPEEGERHPTRGGLRIGKPLPERGPREPLDARLEWDRDGQYFHYLTRWMHALHRVSRKTASPIFHRWAIELAGAAHAAFFAAAQPGGSKRMVWKMSIALDRPLVPSMGHHDPLDALLTFLDLATSPLDPGEPGGGLEPAIADAAAICAGSSWATDDALGIGGLLVDAYRLAHLVVRRGVDGAELLDRLLLDARASLEAWGRDRPLAAPVGHRLAFRELGLSIGLHAVRRLTETLAGRPDLAAAAALEPYLPFAALIEGQWSEPSSRVHGAWTEHRDINAVMLATSLAPDGFLAME